jgi:pSer/pThr/pTyr-binding forkhead associated (FHA) protein
MAFLKIISGELKGTKIQIDRDEIVIGRAPENMVHIDDASISGRHCMIRRDGRRFTLADLKSTNGTMLNNVPIESYRLSAKDIISVGSVDILFDGDDIEDAHPTQIPPTIVQHASKSTNAGMAPEKPGRPAAFGKRKSSKGIWLTISIILGLICISILALFIKVLTKA